MTTTWTEEGRPLSTYEGIEYPVAAHIHEQVDIVNLITGLDSKAPKLSPVIKSASITSDSLVIEKIADQTAHLLNIKNDLGFSQFRVESSGTFRGLYGGQIFPSSASTVGLIVQGNASQSGNLQDWRNSSGTVLSKVYASGAIESSAGLYAGPGAGAIPGSSVVVPFNASAVGTVVRGAASQTANLAEFQNSAGTVLAALGSTGTLALNGTPNPAISAIIVTRGGAGNRGIVAIAGAADNKVLEIRGAASQTANLSEWQDSSGTVLTKIDANGAGYFGNIGGASTQLGVMPRVAGERGLVVRGAASQTANLAEFQNSAGDVLGGFSPAGQLVFNTVNAVATATAGTNGALPTAVAGYMTVRSQTGSTLRVPYYNS